MCTLIVFENVFITEEQYCNSKIMQVLRGGIVSSRKSSWNLVYPEFCLSGTVIVPSNRINKVSVYLLINNFAKTNFVLAVFLFNQRHQYWRPLSLQRSRWHVRHHGSRRLVQAVVSLSAQHVWSQLRGLLPRLRAEGLEPVQGQQAVCLRR